MSDSEQSPPKQQENQRTALQWAKLHIADHARLMMDNQKTLDRSNKSDQQHRDFANRQREHLAKQHNQVSTEPTPASDPDDPMEVNIDSPRITHHHHTAPVPVTETPTATTPAPTSSGMSTLGKMALAGVAAAGLGSSVTVPLVAYQLLKDRPTPIVQPVDHVDTDTQYGLRIYRPGEGAEK